MRVAFSRFSSQQSFKPAMPRFGKNTLLWIDYDGTLVESFDSKERKIHYVKKNKGFGEEKILKFIDSSDVLVLNTGRPIEDIKQTASLPFLNRVNTIVTRDGTGIYFKKNFKNEWEEDKVWQAEFPQTYNFYKMETCIKKTCELFKEKEKLNYPELQDTTITEKHQFPSFKIKIEYNKNNIVSDDRKRDVFAALLGEINTALSTIGQTDYRIATYNIFGRRLPHDTIKILPRKYDKASPFEHLLAYYQKFWPGLDKVFVAGDEENDVPNFQIRPSHPLKMFYTLINAFDKQLYADILYALDKTRFSSEDSIQIQRGFHSSRHLYIPKTDKKPPDGILEALEYFTKHF